MDKETADFILKLAATVISALVVSVPIAFAVLQRLGKLIPALSQQGEKLDQNTDLLRQALRDRADEGSFYRAQLDKIEKRAETLEEQVRSQALQLIDREHKSQENKRQIEELTTTSQQNQKALQEKIDALQKDSSMMQQDLNAEKVKVKETEEKLTKAQNDLDQARKEVGELRDRLTILETQHTADVAEKERLTLELKAKDDRIKELESRVKELETELADLRTKVNSTPEPPKPPEPTTP